MRTWITEFGQEYEVPDVVTARLTDNSWHNDTCPRFVRKDDPTLSLWVEHPDPQYREPQGCPRFLVTRSVDEGPPDVLLETNSLEDAMEHLMNAPKSAAGAAQADNLEYAPKVNIQAGDIVRIKPEWLEPGEERISWKAAGGVEGDRVNIQAQLGLPINPIQTVRTSMLEEPPTYDENDAFLGPWRAYPLARDPAEAYVRDYIHRCGSIIASEYASKERATTAATTTSTTEPTPLPEGTAKASKSTKR